MKKYFTILFALLTVVIGFAQSPQRMSYQSVIRNTTNDLITETPVGIQISIIQGTPAGAAVYVETHTPTTNANGLASLKIGDGSIVTGTFSSIDWSNGPFFIKTETDPDGGTSYSITGTSELLSVPYALYAKEVSNAVFATEGNVTSNSYGDYVTDDFVFGSPQLDSDGVSVHNPRMFFDKSKWSFRAGNPNNSNWDNQNMGLGSIAMGFSTLASGNYSTAFGSVTSATAEFSTAMGNTTTASGESSTAMGRLSSASGERSTAFGSSSQAVGSYSTAMGLSNVAASYGETALGVFGTFYSPQSAESWSAEDRIFVLGNGTNGALRSNAMVVLKNGNVGLGTSTPNEVLEIGGDGRAFIGDSGGENRKGLIFAGLSTPTSARIESFDYGSFTGRDLVFNSVGQGNVGVWTNNPTAAFSVNGTANKTGGGSWAVFSDRRLKKDISSFEDGLSSALKIDPVKFKYNGISKADTINEYVGVIAQELEKVSPYMINTIEIEGIEYLEVDNSAMTYMLINAIQELNTTIENQGEQIEELNNENSELKAEISNHLDMIEANNQLLQELRSVLNAQVKQ